MHSIFSVSTSGKDMDSRFSDVIASMSLDTEGELVQPFTGQGTLANAWMRWTSLICVVAALFRAFSSPWDEAVTEWAESCSSDEQGMYNLEESSQGPDFLSQLIGYLAENAYNPRSNCLITRFIMCRRC